MKGFSNSNLFLREFIFKWPTITFFEFSNRNDLVFKWKGKIQVTSCELRV